VKMVDFYRSFIGVLSLSMKLSLSCRALLWSAPGRDFLSDRGVVDATTLARLGGGCPMFLGGGGDINILEPQGTSTMQNRLPNFQVPPLNNQCRVKGSGGVVLESQFCPVEALSTSVPPPASPRTNFNIHVRSRSTLPERKKNKEK